MTSRQPPKTVTQEVAGKWILPVILGIPLGALIMCGVISGAGVWIVGGIGFILVAGATKRNPAFPPPRPHNPPHRKEPDGQRTGSRQRY